MMPIGVPRVPYRTPKVRRLGLELSCRKLWEGWWQWVGTWSCPAHLPTHLLRCLLPCLCCLLQEGSWQWVDIWNCLYRERIIFLSKAVDEELGNQVCCSWLGWWERMAGSCSRLHTVGMPAAGDWSASSCRMLLLLWANRSLRPQFCTGLQPADSSTQPHPPTINNPQPGHPPTHSSTMRSWWPPCCTWTVRTRRTSTCTSTAPAAM